MTTHRPDAAMVLAAGLATRLRPLTENRPKAMMVVAGRPIIDYGLDRLTEAGVERAVVNLHHCGEILERHLAERQQPRVVFSPEDRLRGTAGGVRAALDQLGPEPFYVINGDVVWLDGPEPVLDRLAAQWDPRTMDALVVVVATVKALGVVDRGDFEVEPDGRLAWPEEGRVAPFAYAGIQLVHPRLFADLPDDPVAMSVCWQRAMEADRLRAIAFDGIWAHIGTAQALQEADRLLEGQGTSWGTHGV